MLCLIFHGYKRRRSSQTVTHKPALVVPFHTPTPAVHDLTSTPTMSQSYVFLPPIVNHQKHTVPIPSAAQNAPNFRLSEYTTLVERFLVHLFSVPQNIGLAFPGSPIAHFRPYISSVLHYSGLLDKHEYIIFSALLLLNKIRERHGKDIQWIFGVQFLVPSLMVATKYHIDRPMFRLTTWAQIAQYADGRKLAEWERSFCAAAGWDFVVRGEELKKFEQKVRADFGVERKGGRMVNEWPIKTKEKGQSSRPAADHPKVAFLRITTTTAIGIVASLPPGFIPFATQPHPVNPPASIIPLSMGAAQASNPPAFYQAELPEEQRRRITSTTTAMPGTLPVHPAPVMKVDHLPRTKSSLNLPGLGQAAGYLHQLPMPPVIPLPATVPAGGSAVAFTTKWKLF
jgi:hypothetical protein